MVLDSSTRMNGKRIREEDDEVYLDNYHSNKRYLTEVISSSLNGLRVGDSTPDLTRSSRSVMGSLEIPNDAECPAKHASLRNHWDDLSTLDSPMSDDSDDNSQDNLIREREMPRDTPILVSDSISGSPASPLSPEKSNSGQLYGNPHKTLHRSYSFPNTSSTFPYALSKYQAESSGRLPPSPSDACQPADLRRAALLRALQLHALSPGRISSELVPERPEEAKNQNSAEHHEQSSGAEFRASDELVLEQPDDIGSPVHGIFTGLSARGSTRARTLRLDD